MSELDGVPGALFSLSPAPLEAVQSPVQGEALILPVGKNGSGRGHSPRAGVVQVCAPVQLMALVICADLAKCKPHPCVGKQKEELGGQLWNCGFLLLGGSQGPFLVSDLVELLDSNQNLPQTPFLLYFLSSSHHIGGAAF